MPDFSHRSTRLELLDAPGIPFADIERNMAELDRINTLLGGHAVSISGLQPFLVNNSNSTPLHICEIGCGGGDNLRVLGRWCQSRGISVQLTGIDYNEHCIAFARSRKGQEEITFHCNDYRQMPPDFRADVLFSSLFCHHFTDAQLVPQLLWMQQHSNRGFFINDLHRHPLAYYSIKLLTQGFSRSYLVKNDAPLSVLRGFRRHEWTQLLTIADIQNYALHWRWAFRWLLTVQHG